MVAALGLSMGSCDANEPDDGGVEPSADAGTPSPDAGVGILDAGVDAGNELDAGAVDVDGGQHDSGPGVVDSGILDGGSVNDAGPTDGGLSLPAITIATTIGASEYSFETADGIREFEVNIPPGLEDGAPLVFLFRGGDGGTGLGGEGDFAGDSGVRAKAAELGFVLIVPDQVEGEWNDGRPTGANEAGIDDVGFTETMVALAIRDLGIDPAQVYSTGFSNGAIFSGYLACNSPGLLAAIGPVAGLLPQPLLGCETTPVHVFQIAGALDPFQIPDGSPSTLPFVTGEPLASAYLTASHWADLGACSDQTDLERMHTRSDTEDEVEFYSVRNCDEGVDIDFYILDDHGHAWPGGEDNRSPAVVAIGGPQNNAINATNLLFEFFSSHTRP